MIKMPQRPSHAGPTKLQDRPHRTKGRALHRGRFAVEGHSDDDALHVGVALETGFGAPWGKSTARGGLAAWRTHG